MNGFDKVELFSAQAEELDGICHSTLEGYWGYLEKMKVKNPPKEVQHYLDYLCMSSSTRKSFSNRWFTLLEKNTILQKLKS
jgi:hypothetical protein